MEQSHTIEKTLAVLLVLGWFVTPDLLANPRCCKLAAKYETRASRSLICVASFPGNPQEGLFAGLISISDCSFLNVSSSYSIRNSVISKIPSFCVLTTLR